MIRSCCLEEKQYCQTWNNFPPDCVTSSLFVVDEDEGDEEDEDEDNENEDEGDEEENLKGRISCLSVSLKGREEPSDIND